jgi:hypothetical protein
MISFIGILFCCVIITANILVFKEVLWSGAFESQVKRPSANDLALTKLFSQVHIPRLMASPRGTHGLEERRSVHNTTNVNGVE